MLHPTVRHLFLALLSVAFVVLTACTPSNEEAAEDSAEPRALGNEDFIYQIGQPLLTTNAASKEGTSVNAELLSARLYPGFYVPGPSGEMIPNTDLGTAQPLPGVARQVIYTINPEARYSDGAPVTCADFLLAHGAEMMPGIFSSHQPLLRQIERIDCQPGQQQFSVYFHSGGEGGRWRLMFGPGTLLPAHAIADKAGISVEDLIVLLKQRDQAALRNVAQVWNEGFRLENFDHSLQVSFGPYRIKSVDLPGVENPEDIQGIRVNLAGNPLYAGDIPSEELIVVVDNSWNTEELHNTGGLRIADFVHEIPTWLGSEPSYATEQGPGYLTEALVLSNNGLLATPEARKAFAACVDQNWLAATSSELAGIDVGAVLTQVVPHDSSIGRSMNDISQPHAQVDPETAAHLSGSVIRVGYFGPDPRKAGMINILAESCVSAGITVVDASAEGSLLSDLGDAATGIPGVIDAYLMAIDPMREHIAPDERPTDLDKLRQAERAAWDALDYIPVAAQPRAFLVDPQMSNVVTYTGLTGIGWNMDRWTMTAQRGDVEK